MCSALYIAHVIRDNDYHVLRVQYIDGCVAVSGSALSLFTVMPVNLHFVNRGTLFRVSGGVEC